MSGFPWLPWQIELIEIWRVLITLALLVVFSLQIIVLYEWRELRRNADRRESAIRETIDGIRKDRAEFLARLAGFRARRTKGGEDDGGTNLTPRR